MDGYAVRCSGSQGRRDVAHCGISPAGNPFGGSVGAGEAVRIFTGGVVPQGADAIVIQEDTDASGDRVMLKADGQSRHIRPAGLDFKAGDVLAPAGKHLTPRDLSLIAAGDVAKVEVHRRPRVAFVATGVELSQPGEAPQARAASSHRPATDYRR